MVAVSLSRDTAYLECRREHTQNPSEDPKRWGGGRNYDIKYTEAWALIWWMNMALFLSPKES